MSGWSLTCINYFKENFETEKFDAMNKDIYLLINKKLNLCYLLIQSIKFTYFLFVYTCKLFESAFSTPLSSYFVQINSHIDVTVSVPFNVNIFNNYFLKYFEEPCHLYLIFNYQISIASKPCVLSTGWSTPKAHLRRVSLGS